MKGTSLLSVENLRISFETPSGRVKAVRGVSFALHRGVTTALVGESGSGKSVTAKAIMGLLSENALLEEGHIFYEGRDLLHSKERELNRLRGSKIAIVLQDPMSSLDPISSVGKQLLEALWIKERNERREGVSFLRSLYERAPFLRSEILLPEERESLLMGELSEEKDDQLRALEALDSALLEFKEKVFASFPSNEREGRKAVSSLRRGTLAVLRPLLLPSDNVLQGFAPSFLSLYHEKNREKKRRRELKRALKKEKASAFEDLSEGSRARLSEHYRDDASLLEDAKRLFNALVLRLEEIEEEPFDPHALAEALLKKEEETKHALKNPLGEKEKKEKALSLLQEVGMDEPERRLGQYPFELSGGQKQRIAIAMALAGDPEILLLDEPTTALDVTTQAQILRLIETVKQKRGLSILFITHDLGVVANVADEVEVFYEGKILEEGSVYDIFFDPRHPYTWGLLSSIIDQNSGKRLETIKGSPSDMLVPPLGDPFYPRNPYALTIDRDHEPPAFSVSPTHVVRSFLLAPEAEEVIPPKGLIERIEKALSEDPKNVPEPENDKNSPLKYVRRPRHE